MLIASCFESLWYLPRSFCCLLVFARLVLLVLVALGPYRESLLLCQHEDFGVVKHTEGGLRSQGNTGVVMA
eukprot:750700-Hanusia_phi.AAC.7